MLRFLTATALATALAAPLAAQQAPAPAPSRGGVSALEEAAAKGNALAAMQAAEAYLNGSGVPQNPARAAQLLAQAAQTGRPEAQNALGKLMIQGAGVRADPARGLQLLQAAAEQGNAAHIRDYADMLSASNLPDGPAQAAQLYSKAALMGDLPSSMRLGLMYRDGRGVGQDLARARQFLTAPAEAGEVSAQVALAGLLANGAGGDADPGRAAALLQKAAEAGDAGAMRSLAVMYERGLGVEQSAETALRLYRAAGAAGALPVTIYDPRLAPPVGGDEAIKALQQSAVLGDPVAQFQLGVMSVSAPDSGFAEWQQAAVLFSSGAQKGHAAAMAALGLLYMHGLGVPQDYVQGEMWLMLAASAGFAEGPALAAMAQGRMSQDQLVDAQKMAQARWAAMTDTSGLSGQ